MTVTWRRAGTFLPFRQNGTAHLFELTCAICSAPAGARFIPAKLNAILLKRRFTLKMNLKNAIIHVIKDTLNP